MLRRSSTWPSCDRPLCSNCLSPSACTSSDTQSIMSSSRPRILIYVLRRDVRLSDNPLFYNASLPLAERECALKGSTVFDLRDREDSLISDDEDSSFTHVLPVYVFPADQIEVKGFLTPSVKESPYPDAISEVAGFWRTGPHRLKFMAEGAWDLKERLEGLGCGTGLEIRVGTIPEVVEHMLDWYAEDDGDSGKRADVVGVWMTSEEGVEEKRDERKVRRIAQQKGVEFKTWEDEKYYIDDRDVPFDKISDLPNVYTTYRKSLEPLRDRPRRCLPTPSRLPPLPPEIPPQQHPFEIPCTLETLKKALLSPLELDTMYDIPTPPQWPSDAQSAHPFEGGETKGQERMAHLISSGAMSSYKATRNGMLGLDFSTKLSAYLAQGYLTARQIHWAMSDFEAGKGPGKGIEGYGKGENDGTAAVRFELLWRDYMRLCIRKFGPKMFHIHGIRDQIESGHAERGLSDEQQQKHRKQWKVLDNRHSKDAERFKDLLTRFRSGRTGIGLIDASNRELYLTGYTSNRARQNVASFLSSHLGIDWRIGAEWYEYLLTDYDVASNWGNWQYVAGVGNDPRQGRIFNPVKQALDYDGEGKYIKTWVPELRGVQIKKTTDSGKQEVDQQKLMGLYQAWRLSDWEKENLGLKGLEWVDDPLIRIQFSVRGKGGGDGSERRGRGRAGRGRGRGRDFKRMGEMDKAGRPKSVSNSSERM